MLAINPTHPLMSLLDALGRAMHWLWPRAKHFVDGEPTIPAEAIPAPILKFVERTIGKAMESMQGQVIALQARDGAQQAVIESLQREIERLKSTLKEAIHRRRELSIATDALKSTCATQVLQIAELEAINRRQQGEINELHREVDDLRQRAGLPIIYRVPPAQLPPGGSNDEPEAE